MSTSYGTIRLSEPRHGRRFWMVDARPDIALRMKRLFPRIRQGRTGVIDMDDTPDVCRDLEWLIGRWPMEMDDAALTHLTEQANGHRQMADDAHLILSGRSEQRAGVRTPLREPREYQTVAADLALKMGRLLVVDGLGLGKSYTGLLTLKEDGTLPAVVVCQAHLASQWLTEIKKTWADLDGYEVTKQTAYDLSAVCGGQAPDVIVITYNKLHGWADQLAGIAKTVIFDEAQELRRTGTKKYDAAARLAYEAPVRIGLTATPIYNYGAETHSVLDVIAPGELGTAQEFNREWTTGYKGLVHSPVALGEHLRDLSLMVVRTRKDVGREIKNPIRVTQHVDVDQERFDAAKGDAVAMARLILDSQTSRQDRFTVSGRFDAKLRRVTGVAKAPFVAEFARVLLQTERKIVLFGWHRDVLDIWVEALAEFNPLLYSGSETPAKKDEAKRRFTEEPPYDAGYSDPDTSAHPDECRVLIMSLRSGAGLDGLQLVCSTVLFGELDWSPKIHDQGIGRLARDGQTSAVAAYFAVSDVGVDPVIAEILDLKDRQSTGIVHGGALPFEVAENNADRIRLLAEHILATEETP